MVRHRRDAVAYFIKIHREAFESRGERTLHVDRFNVRTRDVR